MAVFCAYFDCFSGASGDMLLGALLDAGLGLEELRHCLASLPIQGYEIVTETEVRQGVRGTKTTVRYSEEGQPHRHLMDIIGMIENSALPAAVKSTASAVFWRLARAEARVHGVAPEEVHFHEVGAVDSIVDVVGVVAGLHLLGVQAVYASPLPLGGGTVQTEHGTLPVPAPATLQILTEAHVPTRPHPAQVELVTPTGAALLAELAHFEQPAMTIESVGYGFGTRRVPALNAVRVWLGKASEDAPWSEDEIVLLECNLDDATGQVIGYVQGRLLEAGALDVWYTPIYMKKNRPGILLTALARPAQASELAALILRETPTFGLRWQRMSRSVAERTVTTVETPWGKVQVKVKLLHGQAVAATPEFEDCACLARAAGVPWQAVHDAAKQAWAAQVARPQTSQKAN
ncbi:MAG: nickel pincer cofactor biosynthesis protein LarC [Chloroflexi bacterium]|nr:nickel pincer cofactor biosynthesis protein LarC [Chloroflexota bacterium]